MTRILLALLALLGLVVQAAPAEASVVRGTGSAEVGALAVTRSQARAVVAQVEQRAAPASPETSLGDDRPSAAPCACAVPVPTVLTGIDRARE